MKRFISYQDEARLEYGRMLWKNPVMRDRLERHWKDPRHPYSIRYQEIYAPLVSDILETSPDQISEDELDRRLRERGFSLRVVVREIPPIFGSFWS